MRANVSRTRVLRSWGWVAGVSLAMLASTALGQDIQHFRPTAGTWNALSVESGRTAPAGELWGAMYASYGSRPLVVYDSELNEPIDSIVSSLWSFDVLAVIGLTEWIELGVSVPLMVVQGSLGARAEDGFRLGDVWVRPKATLWSSRAFAVALALPVSLPTGDADAFVGASTTTFQPQVAVDGRFGTVRLSVNGGLHFRSTQTTRTLEVGDAITYGAAFDWQFVEERAHLLLEVFGESPVETVPDSEGSPLEFLVGLRLIGPEWLAVTLGGGFGLVPDYGSPDWRLVVGVSMNGGGSLWDATDGAASAARAGAPPPSELDRDADGVSEERDVCPLDAEDVDGFEDDDGCPDFDDDRDGFVDDHDECPREPEDFDGLRDGDGCPDASDSPEPPSQYCYAASTPMEKGEWRRAAMMLERRLGLDECASERAPLHYSLGFANEKLAVDDPSRACEAAAHYSAVEVGDTALLAAASKGRLRMQRACRAARQR